MQHVNIVKEGAYRDLILVHYYSTSNELIFF